MKLDLGAVARDTATGVVRAWPWLVAAVLLRVGVDLIQSRIDVALRGAAQSMETMALFRMGSLIVREVFDGLALGVVVAAVLHALAVLPDGRLARGLRAWPTAFTTGLVGGLPMISTVLLLAAGVEVSIAGLVGLVLAAFAIILGAFLGYATGGAVARGTGVTASFRDSLGLTRGHRWKLLMVSVALTGFAAISQYGGSELEVVIPEGWAGAVAPRLTGWSAGILNVVVGAAVWANLDRIRRRESADGVAEAFD